MLVSDLAGPALRARLRGPGLRLRTGPVVNLIRTHVPAVEAGIALHYASHPVEDDACFADFDVCVAHPRGLRSLLRPQVEFRFDGDSPFNPLPGNQGFPMLEWGLNWCVSSLCHQYIILHSAVIEREGAAMILPAPSGSGKSTLCAGLSFHGWRLLSDELALIDPQALTITPLPRPISLKNASIEVIRRAAPGAAFGPVVHDTIKGSVAHVQPPTHAVRNGRVLARPGWVVLPRYEAAADTRLRPLPKAQALMLLIDNAFNHGVHGAQGFEALAAVIERSDCFEFTYSRLDEAIALMATLPAPLPAGAAALPA
jgi:HprK-related kinase A